METHSEACIFAGYPKDMWGDFFYSSKYNKVFASTHTNLLENDYMNNYKPKSEVMIEEITGEKPKPSALIVETHVIEGILKYRRTNIETRIPKKILQ